MNELGEDPRYSQEALSRQWNESREKVHMLRHMDTDELVEGAFAKYMGADWIYWDVEEGFVPMSACELFSMFHLDA
jgi:hypothetical protein